MYLGVQCCRKGAEGDTRQVDGVHPTHGQGVASVIRNERDEVYGQASVLCDEQGVQRLGTEQSVVVLIS